LVFGIRPNGLLDLAKASGLGLGTVSAVAPTAAPAARPPAAR
jgi:hypothetical protein